MIKAKPSRRKLIMVMLNLKTYSLIFILLIISPLAYSEEIDIENIQSSQGIGLNCPASLKGNLSLDIYGETGKRQIILSFINKNFIVNDKETYYVASIYNGGGSESHHPLEITRTIYFRNRQPLSGIAISESDIEKSKEALEILIEALSEAHDKKKCLNWKL